MAQYKLTRLTWEDLVNLGITDFDTQRDIMDAKNLIMWDEDTYENFLPGLLYDLGEAVDRVEVDCPFDDPHFTHRPSLIHKLRWEIESQQRLIAKHETVIATTKWHLKVESDSVLVGITHVGRSSGEESGIETVEGCEKLRERRYRAWEEVDKAFAKVDKAYGKHDKIKADNEVYKARAEHAKARAEFCEWLRRNAPPTPAVVSPKGNNVPEQELDLDSVEPRYGDGSENRSLLSPRGDHTALHGDVPDVPDHAEEEDLGDDTASEEEDIVSSSGNDLEESVSEGSGSDDESDIEEIATEDAEKQAGKTQIEPAAAAPAQAAGAVTNTVNTAGTTPTAATAESRTPKLPDDNKPASRMDDSSTRATSAANNLISTVTMSSGMIPAESLPAANPTGAVPTQQPSSEDSLPYCPVRIETTTVQPSVESLHPIPPGSNPNPPGCDPNSPGHGPNPPGCDPNPPGHGPNPPGWDPDNLGNPKGQSLYSMGSNLSLNPMNNNYSWKEGSKEEGKDHRKKKIGRKKEKTKEKGKNRQKKKNGRKKISNKKDRIV